MCGVAGIFNRDGQPASRALLKRMTDALAHRGPDGEGHFVDGALALGHRRLAIIDLTPAGQQPMRTPDGRFVLSYNGEIYNYRELRIELEAQGHQFRSRSDTEVLLHLLAQDGASGLKRLNGMFAFALWDHQRQELMLARDRYGIKPMYYTAIGDTLLFASEIKAILEHPGYRVALDAEALLEYLTFQNFFTDRTLFRNVKLLPPGCLLRTDRSNGFRIERHWDFNFVEPRQAQADYAEEFDHLFRQAVSCQLVSDVPISCYLSGGMDLGSITAIAAQQIPQSQDVHRRVRP